MTEAELDRAAYLMRRARIKRNGVKTEAQLRAWADKFMVDGLPAAAAEQIGAMYHEMVRRVYGVGGG